MVQTEKDERYDPDKTYSCGKPVRFVDHQPISCTCADCAFTRINAEHNVKIRLPTPRRTCCDDGSCSHCKFWEKVQREHFFCTTKTCGRCSRKECKPPAPKGVPVRVRPDIQETLHQVAERSLCDALSDSSPAKGIEVHGRTWHLSSSRTWDYGSKLGRGCQEIGEIYDN